MTKKNKKRSSDKINKRALISPKQLILIAIVLGAYLLIKNPATLGSIQSQLPFTSNRQIQIASQSASLGRSVKGLYTKAQDYFIEFAENTNIPTKFTGLPDEVVIDDVVATFTQEVKDLPKNQVKRIKTQICQDVIDDATATISAQQ
jgi:hypothetical protein